MDALMIELPLDALASPGVSRESLEVEAKFMLALKLFEVGRLSSAKAASLCGMGRVEFLLAAGRAGVPVVMMGADELNAEFAENDWLRQSNAPERPEAVLRVHPQHEPLPVQSLALG